jgi:hypothetical protein
MQQGLVEGSPQTGSPEVIREFRSRLAGLKEIQFFSSQQKRMLRSGGGSKFSHFVFNMATSNSCIVNLPVGACLKEKPPELISEGRVLILENSMQNLLYWSTD